MLTAALSKTAETWKQPTWPLRQVKCGTHVLLQQNTIQPQKGLRTGRTTTRINLEHALLLEGNHTQKDKHHLTPLNENPRLASSPRQTRHRREVSRDLAKTMGSNCTQGCKFLSVVTVQLWGQCHASGTDATTELCTYNAHNTKSHDTHILPREKRQCRKHEQP